VAVLAVGAVRADAQVLPPPDDSRSGMLRATMLGLLPAQAAVPVTRAQYDCIALPRRSAERSLARSPRRHADQYAVSRRGLREHRRHARHQMEHGAI